MDNSSSNKNKVLGKELSVKSNNYSKSGKLSTKDNSHKSLKDRIDEFKKKMLLTEDSIHKIDTILSSYEEECKDDDGIRSCMGGFDSGEGEILSSTGNMEIM